MSPQETNTGPTLVNGDDFVAALQDGKAHARSEEGVALVSKLRAEGRDHSLPAVALSS